MNQTPDEAFIDFIHTVDDAIRDGDPAELSLLGALLRTMVDGLDAEPDQVPNQDAMRTALVALHDRLNARGQADEAALLRRLAKGGQ